MTESAELEQASSGVPDEVTPEWGFALAMGLVQDSRFDDARMLLERVLEAAPDYVEAMNVLAILSNTAGDRDRALELLTKAVALAPDSATIQNNYGNMLVETGDLVGAVAAYKRAVAIDPRQVDAIHNLASILIKQSNAADAEDLLRHALAIDPEMGIAHKSLAVLLMATNRKEESLDHFWKSMRYLPPDRVSPYVVALAHQWTGAPEMALKVVRDWLDREPNNVEARHLLAGFSGENPPDRASDGYVEKFFDGFARSFESKLASLEYHAPELVGEAVRRALGEPRGDLAVLDAGCGTGLCAPLVKPYAASLTGVDLSARMMEEAVRLKAYDRLVKAELTAFIEANPDAYDVILSADTLCYFGRLDGFAAAARRSMRDNGLLVFTVEKVNEDDRQGFVLAISGRYRHSADYVRETLTGADLKVAGIDEVVLRMENLKPVHGLLVTARR